MAGNKPGPPKGVRFGGRQKGTPNKRTGIQEALDKIVTEDGEPVCVVKLFFDGIMAMPPYQRVDALAKFMEFVYPRRKHVEVKDISDDELKQLLIERLKDG